MHLNHDWRSGKRVFQARDRTWQSFMLPSWSKVHRCSGFFIVTLSPKFWEEKDMETLAMHFFPILGSKSWQFVNQFMRCTYLHSVNSGFNCVVTWHVTASKWIPFHLNKNNVLHMITLFLTQIWNFCFDASNVDNLNLLRQWSHTVKRQCNLVPPRTCKDTVVHAHGEDTGL